MPRTPTAFADAELLAITRALQQLDVAHADNHAFLRRTFDVIDRITGRTFGASVYRRLLAAAGVARSPSGQTVAAVISERKAAPTAAAEAERGSLLDDGLRAFLHKEIRVALDETGVAAPHMTVAPAIPQPTAASGGEGSGLAALLTQRVAALEEENRHLRERAATAEATSRAARAEAASAQAQLAAAQAALADKEAGLMAALQAATEEMARMASGRRPPIGGEHSRPTTCGRPIGPSGTPWRDESLFWRRNSKPRASPLKRIARHEVVDVRRNPAYHRFTAKEAATPYGRLESGIWQQLEPRIASVSARCEQPG